MIRAFLVQTKQLRAHGLICSDTTAMWLWQC